VAARAGVEANVHALSAAFAAFYLSLHPGDVEALKELLGHRSIATTQVYLRKFDKATAMERVATCRGTRHVCVLGWSGGGRIRTSVG
jgi:site-specific recombinase XerC